MYREKRELTQARAWNLCLTIALFKHHPPTPRQIPIWSGIERVHEHEGTDDDLLVLNEEQASHDTLSPASLYLKDLSDARYDITLYALCLPIVLYPPDTLAETSHMQTVSLDSACMESCEGKNCLTTEPGTVIVESCSIQEKSKVHSSSPIKVDAIQFVPENTFRCNNNVGTRCRSKACLFLIQTSHSDDYIGTNAQIIIYSVFQHTIQAGGQIIGECS